MSTKRSVDDDIERTIAERDRLLARAQGGATEGNDRGHQELTLLAEQARMATRIAELEQAMRYFADSEWLARASIDELMRVARAALEGESTTPAEHWLARVERAAAIG